VTSLVLALALVSLMGLMAVGCSPAPDVRELEIREAEIEDAIDRARSSVDELGLRLMTALGQQLGAGTPADAITVCSEIAPAAASEISGEGLEIRRISLRYRNPVNAPDDWEGVWLRRFDESFADGVLPEEVHEIDAARGELRYLRPILVGTGCLLCHGNADQLDGEVQRQLAEHYPLDRATGFALGDLRGAFSVRVRMGPEASD
jgi:hypothetical protein